MALYFIQGRRLNFPRLSYFGALDNAATEFQTPPHFHCGYEITYVERGQAQATLDDGLTTITLGPRDLILFAPGYKHQLSRKIRNTHFWLGVQTGTRVAHVEGGSIPVIPGQGSLIHSTGQTMVPLEKDNPFFNLELPENGYAVLRGFSRVLPILRDLYSEVQSPREDTRPMLLHLCGLLLHTIARGIATTTPNDLVSKVKDEIDHFPGGHRSLASMARDHGTHPVTLSRNFRKVQGTTLVAYRNDRRFHEAFRLLSSGMKPMEVAEKLGFPDYPYFSRFFKARAGFPPGQLLS